MSVIEGLFEEGHNITVLSMSDNKKNGIHFLDLRETEKTLTGEKRQDINVLNFAEINLWTRSMLDFEFHLDFCETLMKSSGFEKLFNYSDSFKFDLLVYDSMTSPCLLGFQQKFKIMNIVALLINVKESILHDRNVIKLKRNSNIGEMSFIERVENFCLKIFRILLHERLLSKLEEKMSILFSKAINLKQIYSLERIKLINSHWSFAGLNINTSKDKLEMVIN